MPSGLVRILKGFLLMGHVADTSAGNRREILGFAKGVRPAPSTPGWYDILIG
jgi:hypothetical protein